MGRDGYLGRAELVNMRVPMQLIAYGVHVLPCIGDGRLSGFEPAVKCQKIARTKAHRVTITRRERRGRRG